MVLALPVQTPGWVVDKPGVLAVETGASRERDREESRD